MPLRIDRQAVIAEFPSGLSAVAIGAAHLTFLDLFNDPGELELPRHRKADCELLFADMIEIEAWDNVEAAVHTRVAAEEFTDILGVPVMTGTPDGWQAAFVVST